jgi:hypothetical protein
MRNDIMHRHFSSYFVYAAQPGPKLLPTKAETDGERARPSERERDREDFIDNQHVTEIR